MLGESQKFVENISSYQYSHLEYDNSIDWIEGDLKNYLKSSNSKIIIPLFHKSKLLGILCIGEKFMSEKYNAALGAFEKIKNIDGPLDIGIGTGSTTDIFTENFLTKIRGKIGSIYSSSKRTTNLLNALDGRL